MTHPKFQISDEEYLSLIANAEKREEHASHIIKHFNYTTLLTVHYENYTNRLFFGFSDNTELSISVENIAELRSLSPEVLKKLVYNELTQTIEIEDADLYIKASYLLSKIRPVFMRDMLFGDKSTPETLRQTKSAE